MFKKRIKSVVVPAHEYTDYSDWFEGDEKYATLKHVAIAATFPSIVAVGTGLFMFMKLNDNIPPQICLYLLHNK